LSRARSADSVATEVSQVSDSRAIAEGEACAESEAIMDLISLRRSEILVAKTSEIFPSGLIIWSA